MDKVMDEDEIREEVIRALETYSIEEVLEQSDLTIEEALVILVSEGWLKLPDVKVLKI